MVTQHLELSDRVVGALAHRAKVEVEIVDPWFDGHRVVRGRR
jgi:hypothetical protein